jgi:uncharacterized Fe-S cluster-containing radical SAM superfamily protein
MPIDTAKFSAHLRTRMLDRENHQILMTRLNGSDQEKDLSVPANCGGLGRIRHFRRATSPGWPENSLPIDPAAQALGLDRRLEVIEAIVFQNSGCNWRCWYCYVPFDRLSASEQNSAWISMNDLIRLYAALPDRPKVVDLSGGQPELTPEMTLWTMRALREQGLDKDCFLWSDDNLSEDYFWTKLSDSDREEISEYKNYGRVGCFKGFDAASFSFNTLAAEEWFDRQFDVMRRSIASGLKMYGYATFTAPDRSAIRHKMGRFVDRLQQIHNNLPLRIVPLEVQVFTPTSGRIRSEHLFALNVQREAIEEWNHELSIRFTNAERAQFIDQVVLQ